MAGVSAACIAPPLITGFATLFFGKYFDTNERNAGLVNFILGSTHITEGAIPFAAKDPLKVLPQYDARIFNCGSLNVYVWGTSASTSWRISCFTSCYSRCSMGSGNFSWFIGRWFIARFCTKSRIAKQEQSLSKMK